MAESVSWEMATFISGCLGGIFGLWQYYKSNKEARARAAADELELFYSDDSVKAALRILDWTSGYIPYVDDAGVRDKKYFGKLDFHLALRPHRKRRNEVRSYVEAEDHYLLECLKQGANCDQKFSPVELYVRDVFDRFLGRLERIESLISSGVVDHKNFEENFSYWLRLIGDFKQPGDKLDHFSNKKRAALIDYIVHYEFFGVQRLFARYGKNISDTSRQASRPELPTDGFHFGDNPKKEA
ncbi:hypothetical protein ACQKKX_08550 [Neorhizobium sp. NPDC001467]|uniref:hypothetical protein n=1 Tax=Neorhizobium sp. NPDC001467 TaxID=3390595 RepID=UPI003D043D1A